jgi:hypothetical protein
MKKCLTIILLSVMMFLVSCSFADQVDQADQKNPVINSEVVDLYDIYWDTEYDAYYIIADGWAIETQELDNTAKMRSADKVEVFFDEYDNITGYEFQ